MPLQLDGTTEGDAGDRSAMENAVRPLDDGLGCGLGGLLGLSWSWERTPRAGSPGRGSTSRFPRVQSVGICCGRGRMVAWSPGGAATGQWSAEVDESRNTAVNRIRFRVCPGSRMESLRMGKDTTSSDPGFAMERRGYSCGEAWIRRRRAWIPREGWTY